MKNKENNPYILQSVDNAFRLVEILCEVEEIGVTELAKQMELGKSTAFRLLATLEKWGYVRKNEENNKYRLGIKFAYVGTIVLERQEIIKYSRPYLEELSWETNETVHLAVMEDDCDIRFLDKVMGNSMFYMESFVGGKKPSYATGTGKALLSTLPDEKVLNYFKKHEIQRFTEHTITDPEEFLEEVKRIREQGYAVDNEESEIGLTCYAVPIYNANNEAIAAISLSGPTTRMKKNSEDVISSIMHTAKEISKSIR